MGPVSLPGAKAAWAWSSSRTSIHCRG